MKSESPQLARPDGGIDRRRGRRSLMPVLIIIVAGVLFLLSIWTDRQDQRIAADTINQLIQATCRGGPPPKDLRWSNATVRASCLVAMQQLCDLTPNERSTIIVKSTEIQDGLIARINPGGDPHMNLQLQQISGELVIRGWSTE